MFFPGIGTTDSYNQLNQIRELSFNTQHPPAHSVFWGSLIVLSGGSEASILFVQLAILAAATFILSSTARTTFGRWAFLSMWVLPWVTTFFGMVWKDVTMAFVLLLAISILKLPRRKLTLTLFFLALSLAILFRHNAIAAVIPILIYGVAYWGTKPSLRKAVPLLLAHFVIFVGLSALVEYWTTPEKRSSIVHSQADDLAIISLEVERSLLPGTTLAEIRQCEDVSMYGLQNNGFIRCLDGWGPGENSLRNNLSTTTWISGVVANLDIYLPYIFSKAWQFVYHEGSPWAFHIPESQGVPENETWIFEPNVLSDLHSKLVYGTAKIIPVFFLPLFWLAVGVGVIAISSMRRIGIKDKFPIFVSVSGILYIISFIPFNHGATYRYSYWGAIAITVATVSLVDGLGLRGPHGSGKKTK